MMDVENIEVESRKDSIIYHYPLWAKWFTCLICLVLTVGFVWWLIPNDNESLAERLMGYNIVAAIVMFLGLLWMYRNANQILGYVELTPSSLIQHYRVLHNRTFYFSEIKFVKFDGEVGRGPIDANLPEGKLAWLGFIALLFTPGGLALLGQVLQPRRVLLGLKGGRRKNIDNLIDPFELSEKLQQRLQDYAGGIKDYPNSYGIDDKKEFILMSGLYLLLLFFFALFVTTEANFSVLSTLIAAWYILIILALCQYILLSIYQRLRDYRIHVTDHEINFGKLTNLTRYFDPAGCVPQWFTISMQELKGIKRKAIYYTNERRRNAGIVFLGNCWKIEIYDDVPNSNQLVDHVKEKLKNRTDEQEHIITPPPRSIDNVNVYSRRKLWHQMTLAKFLICLFTMFFIEEVFEKFGFAGLVFPYFLFQKGLALYMHRNVYAELNGKRLRFGDTGPKWMRWWNTAYDLPKKDIDLSNLKQVVYRPYPEVRPTGVQHNEAFELKFTKGKSVWFYNNFEHGGDLFNRLVDIARENMISRSGQKS